MYIVTRAHTRPNINVPFFYPKTASTDEFRQYFLENYINTGKSILIEHSHSDDNLTMNSVSMWDSAESFNQFVNDPNCNQLIAAATEYNTNNGIVETITTSDV